MAHSFCQLQHSTRYSCANWKLYPGWHYSWATQAEGFGLVFFFPAVQELVELERGVVAFDSLSGSLFSLHAYLIRIFGDIPAMSMVMRMKGHNGTCPCRLCSILAIRAPNGPRTLYVPLDRRNLYPPGAAVPMPYNPANLPLRSHQQFMAQAREVQDAATDVAEKALAKKYGIKGIPLLSILSSLSFPHSFPFDFMHEIFENLLPNLLKLWSGQFKEIYDEQGQGCRLAPTVLEAIGEACAKSRYTVPSAFGAPTPNIASERYQFTAENWSFWALHLAPSLLQGRFHDARFHKHFIELVELVNLCLQFEITDDDIHQIRVGMIKWVEAYERCVDFIEYYRSFSY